MKQVISHNNHRLLYLLRSLLDQPDLVFWSALGLALIEKIVNGLVVNLQHRRLEFETPSGSEWT